MLLRAKAWGINKERSQRRKCSDIYYLIIYSLVLAKNDRLMVTMFERQNEVKQTNSIFINPLTPINLVLLWFNFFIETNFMEIQIIYHVLKKIMLQIYYNKYILLHIKASNFLKIFLSFLLFVAFFCYFSETYYHA